MDIDSIIQVALAILALAGGGGGIYFGRKGQSAGNQAKDEIDQMQNEELKELKKDFKELERRMDKIEYKFGIE